MSIQNLASFDTDGPILSARPKRFQATVFPSDTWEKRWKEKIDCLEEPQVEKRRVPKSCLLSFRSDPFP